MKKTLAAILLSSQAGCSQKVHVEYMVPPVTKEDAFVEDLFALAHDGKYDTTDLFYTMQGGDYSELQNATFEVESNHIHNITIHIGEEAETIEDVPYQKGGSALAFKVEGNSTYLLSAWHVFSTPHPHEAAAGVLNEAVENYEYAHPLVHVNKESLYYKSDARQTREEYSIYVEDKNYPLHIIAKDIEHDLILLKCDIVLPTFSTFGNSNEVQTGLVAKIGGYPKMISNQIISGYISDAQSNKEVQYAAATVPSGNSGGPVFVFRDGTPELIGINSHNVADALLQYVKVDTVKDFLHDKELDFLLE